MSPITTHVLDTALGRPAADVAVTLYEVAADGSEVEVGRGVTNADGRVQDLLPEGQKIEGCYRLQFAIKAYFESSARDCFYPRVDVLFEVSAQREHYHVPLLLSPFGYSTYRGS